MPDCACNHFPSTLGNVTFDAGVNVGIGTPSPLATLDINGPNAPQLVVRGGATSSVRVFPTGGAISSVEVFETTDTSVTNYSRLRLTMDGLNANVIADAGGTGVARAMTFSAGGAERMRIATNGQVGVGTAAPTATLSVAGDLDFPTNAPLSNPGFVRLANAAGYGLQVATLNFGVTAGGATTLRFVVTNGGNVGIGTGSPAYPLDVNGAPRVSGVLLVGQDLTLNGKINRSIGGALVDQGGCYYA